MGDDISAQKTALQASSAASQVVILIDDLAEVAFTGEDADGGGYNSDSGKTQHAAGTDPRGLRRIGSRPRSFLGTPTAAAAATSRDDKVDAMPTTAIGPNAFNSVAFAEMAAVGSDSAQRDLSEQQQQLENLSKQKSMISNVFGSQPSLLAISSLRTAGTFLSRGSLHLAEKLR